MYVSSCAASLPSASCKWRAPALPEVLPIAFWSENLLLGLLVVVNMVVATKNKGATNMFIRYQHHINTSIFQHYSTYITHLL